MKVWVLRREGPHGPQLECAFTSLEDLVLSRLSYVRDALAAQGETSGGLYRLSDSERHSITRAQVGLPEHCKSHRLESVIGDVRVLWYADRLKLKSALLT